MKILTPFQENILIGSVLGDGTLSLYGRSINALYREHGTRKQNGYRQWKSKHLDLKFLPDKGKIYSPSLPLYTHYYEMFYPNRIKIITKDNIKLLTHPIGLMCLYFDDGSLVIDKYKRKNGIHIFPRVYLYTQSFSLDENIILIEHIKKTFKVIFKLKKVPDGSGYCLCMNGRNEIVHFINLIKPYAEDISCMHYKINIENRLIEYKALNSHLNMIIDSLEVTSNEYTQEDMKLISQLLKNGLTQKEIALRLNRSYYGIIDKIRRMKSSHQ